MKIQRSNLEAVRQSKGCLHWRFRHSLTSSFPGSCVKEDNKKSNQRPLSLKPLAILSSGKDKAAKGTKDISGLWPRTIIEVPVHNTVWPVPVSYSHYKCQSGVLEKLAIKGGWSTLKRSYRNCDPLSKFYRNSRKRFKGLNECNDHKIKKSNIWKNLEANWQNFGRVGEEE